MEDKRSTERKLINQLLRVDDREAEAPLGNLVNLSAGGFMLISAEPIPEGRRFQLSLELPQPVDGKRAVEFSAKCIWCQRSSFSADYGAGFQIEAIPAEERRVLEMTFGSA